MKRDLHTNDRAQIQITDVFMTVFVLVGILATLPVFGKFTGMVVSSADPFTGVLMQVFVPAILIGLLISIGISARGGGK